MGIHTNVAVLKIIFVEPIYIIIIIIIIRMKTQILILILIKCTDVILLYDVRFCDG